MNRRYLAITLRAIAIVLLLVAAFRLAVDLRSSLEVDETTQNGGFGIAASFAMNRLTTILGLVGVGLFWCSFLIPRKPR